MICPICGNPVPSRHDVCSACGCDLTVHKRIIRLSNSYYNEGLERAKVHDLSGAVASLKKSLEINKTNIDARNLLGLVYYEMGEVVVALGEWVISKHFQAEDNDADYFMDRVQDNPSELDNISQAVHKYNLALEAAKEQNDDLAILQLKKVISIHPKFLKALQLISLLYIKNGDFGSAAKYLKRAQKIDVTNTITLRYLAELEKESAGDERENDEKFYSEVKEENSSSGSRGLRAFGSYREDKPNIMVFVNLIIGVIIGIAVVYYLIVPTMENKIREEYSAQTVDYSAELSSKTSTISQQEKKISSLEKRIEELAAEVEDAQKQVPVVDEKNQTAYDGLFTALNNYRILKQDDYTDEQLQNLALELWALSDEVLENEHAKELVTAIRNEIYPRAAKKIYKAGKKCLDENDYESAAGMLEAAVAFNPESDTAMYHLGKALQALERYEEAAYYYRLMLQVCPNSTLKQYIPQRLKECGYSE